MTRRRSRRRSVRPILADLILAGVIVTVAVLNLRPVYVGRLWQQARWQHGWPVPCLWRHRAVEQLERQFGWLTPGWPVPGAPSGSYSYRSGAFLVDLVLVLLLIAAAAWISARLVRGRRQPRKLGPATLVWMVGIAAAVALLVRVDSPVAETIFTGFVCLAVACVLHGLLLTITGLLHRR